MHLKTVSTSNRLSPLLNAADKEVSFCAGMMRISAVFQ